MFDNDEDEVHEDAIGVVTGVNEKKPFMPWHKPRKQWVREKQWWRCLNQLLIKPSNNFETDGTVKYFGLPGAELLDVDYLAMKMLESDDLNKKKLLIHGVISSTVEKQSADSRLASLLDRRNIDPLSKVDRCNFESLEQNNSMLWNSMKRIAPYHLINLDFCDKVFQDRTISAVHKLLEYQFNALLDKPWLFCLTTKVDTTASNIDVLIRLDKCLHSIEEDELAEFNLQKYFAPVFNAISKKNSIRSYTDSIGDFTNIFLVGFVIWLVLSCLALNVDFKLKSSSKYRVADIDSLPDMYSFVFEFNKKFEPQGDRTGVAVSAEVKRQDVIEGLDPREKIIEMLTRTVDLDELLNNDVDLLKRYVDETKALLERCGRDVTNYENEMCASLNVGS